MTGDRLNYLNVVLMAASYVLACLCPIELLVVSYAVLGPLHYLTEIPWLHKRSYFADKSAGFQTCILWSLAAVSLLSLVFVGAGVFACCTYIAIGFAFSLVAVRSTPVRILVLILLALTCVPVTSMKEGHLLFGAFLTTVIHVFVFTWQFVLFGCLKERRLSGFVSLAVFTLCAATILTGLCQVQPLHAAALPFVQNAKAAFGALPDRLADALWLGGSGAGAATKFIAFAYTYHYLNWLSKTRVIKWHELSPRALVLIAILYCGSLLIYAIDYTTGLKVLFFLSVGHVYLEFPLNWRTTIGIFSELSKLCENRHSLNPAFAKQGSLWTAKSALPVIASER